MAFTKLERDVEDRILALKAQGYSYTEIMGMCNVSRGTIHNVLKRRKGTEHLIQEKVLEEVPWATYRPKVERVKPDPGDQDILKAGDFEQPIRDVTPSVDPDRKFLEELTRERTARELLTLLAVSKRGYAEARNSKQNPSDRTWQEIQYLKLYRDSIKLMIEATGLDRDTVMDLPASPVDEFLSKTLQLVKDADNNARIT